MKIVIRQNLLIGLLNKLPIIKHFIGHRYKVFVDGILLYKCSRSTLRVFPTFKIKDLTKGLSYKSKYKAIMNGHQLEYEANLSTININYDQNPSRIFIVQDNERIMEGYSIKGWKLAILAGGRQVGIINKFKFLRVAVDRYEVLCNSNVNIHLIINITLFWDQVIKSVYGHDVVAFDSGDVLSSSNQSMEQWQPTN